MNMTTSNHSFSRFNDETAPSALPVFFRTYSRRKEDGTRESWQEVCDRTLNGISEIGKLTPEEKRLVRRMQERKKVFCGGRWLWVGGTEWVKRPENFYGAYNCSATPVTDIRAFGLIMDLAMQGVGTGAGLEKEFIDQLPPVHNLIEVIVSVEIGTRPKEERRDDTYLLSKTSFKDKSGNTRFLRTIVVGDSRKGWVGAYQMLLEIAVDQDITTRDVVVYVDLGHVRSVGEPLKSFGGTANPVKLRDLFGKVAKILNRTMAKPGRQLDAEDCCLLIDEAAATIVAGSIRRSAGMRQFNTYFRALKTNLWQQNPATGKWSIDPERDALRMANHTRVYHHKPTLEECISSVRSQYHSGEGAIQWAGEAVARANCDLLNEPGKKALFLHNYDKGMKEWCIGYLDGLGSLSRMNEKELCHRMQRYLLNPCGEIIGVDFMCDLAEIHMNNLDPYNLEQIEEACTAGALLVTSLLHHKFTEERYRYSREVDPIVAVCLTGVFDFFVNLFGVDWLRWWEAGRPEHWGFEKSPYPRLLSRKDEELLLSIVGDNLGARFRAIYDQASLNKAVYFKFVEEYYLKFMRNAVTEAVESYCTKHELKVPNRCTAIQPSGTKSLLTGASSGWHPPKAQRFIRRITFRKDDPVALACIDYGYSVVPSPSDKDVDGNLLDDPFDSRVTEWLVEIPTEVPWANLEGADKIDIGKFSALAQFDFAMQFQKYYVGHNTSSTIELTEDEIEPLGQRIYEAIQNDEGYVSFALMARFEAKETFPRLPFEPISKTRYELERLKIAARRRVIGAQDKNFESILKEYDRESQITTNEVGPAGCDSDKCLFPESE